MRSLFDVFVLTISESSAGLMTGKSSVMLLLFIFNLKALLLSLLN